MNASLISLEISVIGLGLVLLLADFFMPAERRKFVGYAGIAALGAMLLFSFAGVGSCGVEGAAFNGAFVNDGMSLFFKRLFIVAAILVLFIAAEFSDRFAPGSIAEYYSLIVFALAGMLFAASANDFAMLFVSIELITVTFYVLVSFQRSRLASLEAGVKYLILGALSSAFMIFGIALIWGTTGELNFTKLAAVAPQFADSKIFLLGVLLLLVGLGFKIAAFPFQIWAPDVYQGAPAPTTAFLAIGSKAAGFVLLLRVLFTAVPAVTIQWENLLIVISGITIDHCSASWGMDENLSLYRYMKKRPEGGQDIKLPIENITILYGNLCALPQRNIKRLLGYSSISHAGYLLLGVAALNAAGQSAVLYYLAGYLFTVLAAFLVIALVLRHLETEDVSGLAGLSQRSPLLAATMTISMVSLAGIPPLAGFFGKFLLLKSVVEAAKVSGNHGYYCLVGMALVGVVISLYYYFNVVRAIYWSREVKDAAPIPLSAPAMVTAWICMAGIFWLGLFPATVIKLAESAVVFAAK